MEDNNSVLLNVSTEEIGEKETTKVDSVYRTIQLFNNACNLNNTTQIRKTLSTNPVLKKCELLLTFNDKKFVTAEDKYNFRNQVINILLNDAYNKYQNDNNELLFLAAANCNISKLEKVIGEMKKDSSTYLKNINQTRSSESVIIFMIKYGNIENENFVDCLMLLVNAGVDVNKYDLKGKSAIDYVALSYGDYTEETKLLKLREIAQQFLKKGIHPPDKNIPKTIDFLTNVLNIDVENYNFLQMNDRTKLFYYIIKNKTEDFLSTPQKIILDYIDYDAEENTLLQLASRKSEKMLPIVQYLLKNGANPNKTTEKNNLTPLEIAASYNNQKIFEEILKNKKTEIKEEHYNNFVRWRSQPMKVKLFEILLESDKLDPTFTYSKTGNTPLHYAIIFSHKKAIQILLKRRSSLVVKNKFGKCALDMIDADDLEKFFDSCLALDNYTPYFSDVNYKMQFRFNSLVDETTYREVNVIFKMGKHPNLEHLLTHPFIHTFITLKWFRSKLYFWFIFCMQALILSFLFVFFYFLQQADWTQYSCCIFLTSINVIFKAPVFLYYKIRNRKPVFFALQRASLHGTIEILLMICTIGGFFQNQLRSFVFIEIAISFLLTIGYHPRLSKWSLMLQRVFKTFTILLIFFSLIVIGFSAGFHVLFSEDDFFKDFFTSIFRTFIMTTGEFNIDAEIMKNSYFGGYIIFLVFALSVSLVIVNFWTGVAVTDIERIEKNSEINACKNVTIFMLFIEYIYATKYLRKIRKHIRNPLVFLKIDEKGRIFHNPDTCEINFFVHKPKQFEEKGNFPERVDEECFDKIRCHYYKLSKVTKEQEVLNKLEEMSKLLNDIKSNLLAKSGVKSFDGKSATQYKKKKK